MIDLKRYDKKALMDLLLNERAAVERWTNSHAASVRLLHSAVEERDAASRDATAARGELAGERIADQEGQRLAADRQRLLDLSRARLVVVAAERDLCRAQLAERKERERVRHERRRP